MQKPMIISIFTPVHQVHGIHGFFFKLCIDSICNQRIKDGVNWEWIILDNNTDLSTNIENWITEYVKETQGEWVATELLQKIKVYKHIGNCRNIGHLKDIAARLCTGDIVVEHDYDDILKENAVIAVADSGNKNENCDFFYSDWINLQWKEGKIPEIEGTRDGIWVIDKEKISIDEICKENLVNVFGIEKIDYWVLKKRTIPLHLRAWRREFFGRIGGYDGRLEIMDDYDIMIRSLLDGKCCRISMPCVIVNYYGKNTTDKYELKEQYGLADWVFEKYEIRVKNRGDFGVVRYVPELN